MGAGGEDLRMRGGVPGDLFGRRGPDRGQRAGLHLVDLGEDDLVGLRRGVEQRHRVAVRLLKPVPGIDEKAEAAQAWPALEIAFCQPGPTLVLTLRGAREAITGQVDQHETPAEIEEVDLLRAARGV